MKKLISIFCVLFFLLVAVKSWSGPVNGSHPPDNSQSHSINATITLTSEKKFFDTGDTVRIGLNVTANDMEQLAGLFLKFNAAQNQYTYLHNHFLTVDGDFIEPVPIVNEMFPLSAYNLNCFEANSTSPCFLRFPANVLGPGTYSFTAYLADINDVNNTLISSNNLNFYITQAQQCNEVTESGSDSPESYFVEMGRSSGVFTITYETYSVKDRILIFYEDPDTPIFDSGCVGTNGEETRSVSYSGNSTKIHVVVQPDCAGETGTSWYFKISCPNNGV